MIIRFYLTFFIICLSFLSSVNCQNSFGRIYRELNAAASSGQEFSKFQLLTVESPAIQQLHHKTYAKANYWRQDSKSFQLLKQKSPQYLILELKDYLQHGMTVMLEKQVLHGENSRLLSSENPLQGEILKPGLHYRGFVKEYPGSIAAFSFFEDQTMAVLAIPSKGNLVLGKMKALATESNIEQPHVFYYEDELPEKLNFQCGVTDVIPEKMKLPQLINSPDKIFNTRCKTTKIFLECDYKLYQDYNRQINQVKNYITGLFNVVKTLYYNEFVNIEISDIMVWTGQDPFLHTDLSSIIFNYSAYRKNNFTGNLAQLLTTYAPQQQGGIAFLDALCQSFNGQAGPHSFAYIYNSYSQLPTYSWSVFVMSHELGHNFGSPHTHACFWGPNRDMTLDNCQQPESNACPAGPPATGGGTIMSYCHLSGFGINFSKGFGKEPGDFIRTNVQNKSCLSILYTPTIEANINGPYYEGDNIILKARPSKSNFDYDWFHYDYLLPTPKDSILRPTYSGIFKVAISDRCTEYSKTDAIVISDFLVNLGCPVIKGTRDSVFVSLTMNADQGTKRDTLHVPDSLFMQVPAWGKDVLVELHTKIVPQGTSWTRDVTTAYQGPLTSGIANVKYAPNAGEPAQFNGKKTYVRILGKFNPKGDWYFTTNDIKFDNGVDAKVSFSLVISWRKLDSVSSCNIALCDGQSKTFDAGISNANYLWSTGQTSKSISTNQLGPLSVQVTKGSKKTNHTVHLYHYPIQYYQSFTICEGEKVSIGKHVYTKSGMYTDTLIASNGCDSIIASTIVVKPRQVSRDSITLCYGGHLDSIAFYKDTLLTFRDIGINGCDSIYEKYVTVNPEINIKSVSIPACPEIGGSLEVIANGGFGNDYQYEWSNGKTTGKIDNLKSGLYKIKVIDLKGCFVEQEIELKNLDSVGIVSLVFDVSCFGKNDGRIYLDFVSGASPYIINWSHGESTKDILQLLAGTYSVIVQDARGCFLQTEIDVASPDSLFINLAIKGSNGNDGSAKATVSGGVAPYRYEWSTGASASEISDLEPGNYRLKVIDRNGCESISDFTIQEIVSTDQKSIENEIRIFPNPVSDQLIISLKSSSHFHPKIFIKIFDIHFREWTFRELNVVNRMDAVDVASIPGGAYIIELRTTEHLVFRKVFIKE